MDPPATASNLAVPGEPAQALHELALPDSSVRMSLSGLHIRAADGECQLFVPVISSTPAAPTIALGRNTTCHLLLDHQVAPEHIKISIPVEQDDMVSQITGQVVVSQIASGLESSIMSSLNLQGSANEDLAMPLQHVIKALGTIGFLTMVFVISTALYQPAAGAIFGRIKILYYVTLGAIFLSGLAEAVIAVCLSRGRDDISRRFTVGRVVLCGSVMPLVAILGIGGSHFIKG